MGDIFIRNYTPADRPHIRRIAYQTSFLERPEAFLTDQEIVADALTQYFTDYEPESSFVAVHEVTVVGYIVGTRDIRRMSQRFNCKILPGLCLKILQRGLLWDSLGSKFLINVCGGLLRGEFLYPDYYKDYPALLHINLDKNFRQMGIGRKLMKHYEGYLREHRIKGLSLGTMSNAGKEFFLKNGYRVLFTSQRGYLEYGLKEKVPSYIMGKSLIS